MKVEQKSKVIKAGAIAALVALSAGLGAVGHALTTQPVVVEKPVFVEKVINSTIEVPVEVIKEVPVEVVKEVVVTDDRLDVVLEHIFDNDGKVEYLTDDLKDSEVAEIADRIILVNEFKALAVAEVKKELADLVDKEVVAGKILDEEDVERVRINDDADEIVVDQIDFEDKDADLLVNGTFEQDDLKYKFEAEVSFKDGEVDDSKLIKVELA